MLLEQVWRVREEISAECGHDLKKLAAMLRREEAEYGDRLARLPICRLSSLKNGRKRVAIPD